MTRIQVVVAAALFLVLPPVNGFAGELTLDSAISEGREHSPRVQKSQANYDQSRWRHTEELGNTFLPKLSLNGSHFLAKKYQYTDLPFGGTRVSVPGIFPTSALTMDASLPIFEGFSGIRKVRGSSLLEDAAESEYQHEQFALDQEIRLAFYQALAAALLDDVADQNVKTLEDHLKQIEVLRKGGAATNYDFLRVEVQLNEARSDALDAKDNSAIARRRLNELLGLEDDDRMLKGELPLPRPELVAALKLESASSARSDLKALAFRAEASDEFRGAQVTWLIPSLSLGAQYAFYNNLTDSMSDSAVYRSSYNVGVFLRWNLFDGGVSLARAKQAQYEQIGAEKTAELARLKVPAEFELWKRRYLSNSSRYLTKNLDVKKSEESVRLAREEQRAGTRTSSEVLDAELDLFRSKAGVVNAQNSAAEALLRLELTLGRRL